MNCSEYIIIWWTVTSKDNHLFANSVNNKESVGGKKSENSIWMRPIVNLLSTSTKSNSKPFKDNAKTLTIVKNQLNNYSLS